MQNIFMECPKCGTLTEIKPMTFTEMTILDNIIGSQSARISQLEKALEVAINQLVMLERAKEPMGVAVLRVYCEDTRNRITQALEKASQ